jgi:hypothetical protein
MKIFDRQQFGLPVGKPLRPLAVLTFRTVTVAAGVVGDARVIALAAFFDMAAERGSAAHFDRTHHP